MEILVQQNTNLKALNTFGLDATAEYFVAVDSTEQLEEAFGFAKDKKLAIWVLGGGSNLVLGHSIPGLCIHMGIASLDIDGQRVQAGAGLNWHQLVTTTLNQELFGLENLSLIPGQVGAAPIQNIGAYGIEFSEVAVEVNAHMIDTGESITLARSDCGFGYRHSVFKAELRDRAVITSVVLKLESEFQPRLEYAGISNFMDANKLPLSAQSVSEAVCSIRRGKLPDPKNVGNVGSFFKNPWVEEDLAAALRIADPQMPIHKQATGGFKLSAAYLIESADLKGLRVGGAAISDQHSLVIQNDGKASFADVLGLADKVKQSIHSRFDISLDIEPRIYPD